MPAGHRVARAGRRGDRRDLAEREAAPGRPAHRDAAVLQGQILGRGLEVVGGDGERLLPHLGGGVDGRGARQHGDPARERADAVGIPAVSPGTTVTCSSGTESPSATIWARVVSWAWPWLDAPENTNTRPSGIDADADALVRAEPGVLDEEGEADADGATLGARPLALGREAVPADRLGDAPQALGIVAAVVAAGTVVAGDQADVVRELVGLDQVARADGHPVEPEALGGQVQHALHHEHGLRPPRAAHRGDRHAVGVDGGEASPRSSAPGRGRAR